MGELTKYTLKDLYRYLRKNVKDCLRKGWRPVFTVRAELDNNKKIHFYIHPTGLNGETMDFFEDENISDFTQK